MTHGALRFPAAHELRYLLRTAAPVSPRPLARSAGVASIAAFRPAYRPATVVPFVRGHRGTPAGQRLRPARRPAGVPSETMSATLFDHLSVEFTTGDDSLDPKPLRYRTIAPRPVELTEAVFVPYHPQRINITSARRHATPLVEATSLASVSPPPATYKPVLPPALIARGLLSAEQLETTIYAGESHREFFTLRYRQKKSGTSTTQRRRVAYFCGDGTGAGKGRELVSVILDNFNQGRDRAIFLTKSTLLLDSLRRDVRDLLGPVDQIVELSKTKIKEPVRFRKGILFAPYSLVRMSKYATVEVPDATQPDGKRVERILEASRAQQIIDAVGHEFDGVIVLDEIQEAMNADPTETHWEQTRAASAQGEAILELIRALPNARIVYASATGFSRIDAMSYAEALGLWGVDCPFENREEFLEAMDAGGLAALETVARELKRMGRLCARALSYEGVVVENVTFDLDATEIGQYNAIARTVRDVVAWITTQYEKRGALDPALEGRVAPQHVTNSPARFFRQSLTSFKHRIFSSVFQAITAPKLLATIDKRLALGRAVAIQITHTGEAALNRALDKLRKDTPEGDALNLDLLDMSPRQVLINYVLQNHPIHQMRRGTNEDGSPRIDIVKDAEDEPVVDEELLLARGQLIDTIEKLHLPEGVLEHLRARYGDRLAEVHGAHQILVRERQLDGTFKKVIRSRNPASANPRAIQAFLDNEKDLIVFTDRSAGVGVSMEAALKYRNSRLRSHIVFELPWRAEDAVQGMGRTHRTGQIAPPEYIFPRTNIPAQRRILSTLARRVASMGALTRGNRSAAECGLFRAQDSLESDIAIEALVAFVNEVKAGKVAGITLRGYYDQTFFDLSTLEIDLGKHDREQKDANRTAMRKFLNSLYLADLGLDGGYQGLVMNTLDAQIERVTEEWISSGRHDNGDEVFAPDHLRVLSRESLWVDKRSGETQLLTLEVRERPQIATFADASETIAIYEMTSGRHDAGFRLTAAGAVELHVPIGGEDTLNPIVRIITPVSERNVFASSLTTVMTLDHDAAERLWHEAVQAIPMTTRTLTVVSGALFPVWNRLPTYPRTIWRMKTDDGEEIAGRAIISDMVAGMRTRFGLPTLDPTAAKAA